MLKINGLIWLFLTASYTAFGQVKLHFGDMAPDINVSRWVMGNPVVKYEPGRLYLIEFTHTQCKPCREAIPFLTQLSNKYKDSLTVLSIYSYFKTDRKTEETYAQEIERLKQLMGDKMRYTVAIDQRDGLNNLVWRNDAGAFPFSFLVDQHGRVVWWGNPEVSEIDHIVRQVIDGNFTGDIYMERKMDFTKEFNSLLEPYYIPGMKLLPLDSILYRIQMLEKNFPEREEEVSFLKYTVFINRDEELASVYLAHILDKYPDICFRAEQDFITKRHPKLDWHLGIVLLDRDIERSKLDIGNVSYSIFLKSKIYAINGEYEKAMAALKEAIDLRKKHVTGTDKVANQFMDWAQAYEFHLLRMQDTAKAYSYLNDLMSRNVLTTAAAGGLVYRMSEGLPPAKLTELKGYIRQHQRTSN